MPQTCDHDVTGQPALPPTRNEAAYRLGCLHTAAELLRRARTWPTRKTVVPFLETLCTTLAQGLGEPSEQRRTGLLFTFDPEDSALGGRWTVQQGDDDTTWTITSPGGLTDTFEAAEVTDVLAWIGGVLMWVRFEQRRTPRRAPGQEEVC